MNYIRKIAKNKYFYWVILFLIPEVINWFLNFQKIVILKFQIKLKLIHKCHRLIDNGQAFH